MYSSTYSQAKYGREAREHTYKTKGKSCGYYVKIVFFFSSLIQSLIIVSLVLFLIYGQPAKSAEQKRIEELEQSFNRLSDINIQLRKEKAELGTQLRARTAEKTALEKEMEKHKALANKTEQEMKMKLSACEAMKMSLMTRRVPLPVPVSNGNELKTCQSLTAQLRAMVDLIQANFTRTVQTLSQEKDMAVKDRDMQHQDAIHLRRENSMVKEQLNSYTRKCKEEFTNSLAGIQTVTRDFLNRINNMFPHQLTFHLSCDKQKEEIEKIKSSCTNLSRDIENKFQAYLDKVGDKVANIQGLSSHLEVQNKYLTSEFQQCERNRNETIVATNRQIQLYQKVQDERMETLLKEQDRLRKDKALQDQTLALKETELQNLRSMLSVQSSFKSGFPKPSGFQGAPQHTVETDMTKFLMGR
ncbi:Plasmalemma vesicle-associated protein [Channa argus]|uniref:Plasmalemma vesicle-associated protein n=1 Tax=Channa argus TaxID=215402 RepID=A0A6G1PKE1_CHAAH|nr:Plasmalemma vesicle-associated protein [Channa argus]